MVEETLEQVARERKEEVLVAKERRKQEAEKEEEEGKSLLEQFQVMNFNPFLPLDLEHVVNLGQILME